MGLGTLAGLAWFRPIHRRGGNKAQVAFYEDESELDVYQLSLQSKGKEKKTRAAMHSAVCSAPFGSLLR